MVAASVSVAGWPDPHRRTDPFAELLRSVAADADNAYRIDQYLWVLDEAPLEPCRQCGRLFDPGIDYEGEIARGLPRLYCSLPCSYRAAWERRSLRWGSAA